MSRSTKYCACHEKWSTLCKPAQSKCAWTSHKSHFMREFSMNMLQAKSWKNSRRRLCASLRSRNAHGRLTRAILCENLQEKSRWAESVPWSNAGLNTYRKNPSVWTVDTLFGEKKNCAKPQEVCQKRLSLKTRWKPNYLIVESPWLQIVPWTDPIKKTNTTKSNLSVKKHKHLLSVWYLWTLRSVSLNSFEKNMPWTPCAKAPFRPWQSSVHPTRPTPYWAPASKRRWWGRSLAKVTDVAMGSKATKITTGYIYIHMSYLLFKKMWN